MESLVVEMRWALVLIFVSSVLMRALEVVWLKPRRLRSALRKQGISGPPPTFLYGNLSEMNNIQSTITTPPQNGKDLSHHWWSVRIFPYLQQWAHQYGQMYMYSTGNKQHLYVSQPQFVKELNLHKSLDFGRPSYLTRATEPMLGDGIIKANGQHWAYQRKLIAPEFFLDKVKEKASSNAMGYELYDTFIVCMQLTMVIHETLRLYGPGVIIAREAFADIKFGNFLDVTSTRIWSKTPCQGIMIHLVSSAFRLSNHVSSLDWIVHK
ncbi:hypothetical protein L1049_008660 [Liquidambar formosana]|uniref:Cytochrome P450 n=1 Tax=Liquidambar formosana TaxID=63359 RepID=A0AAP0S3Y4_LIQFO